MEYKRGIPHFKDADGNIIGLLAETKEICITDDTGKDLKTKLQEIQQIAEKYEIENEQLLSFLGDVVFSFCNLGNNHFELRKNDDILISYYPENNRLNVNALPVYNSNVLFNNGIYAQFGNQLPLFRMIADVDKHLKIQYSGDRVTWNTIVDFFTNTTTWSLKQDFMREIVIGGVTIKKEGKNNYLLVNNGICVGHVTSSNLMGGGIIFYSDPDNGVAHKIVEYSADGRLYFLYGNEASGYSRSANISSIGEWSFNHPIKAPNLASTTELMSLGRQITEQDIITIETQQSVTEQDINNIETQQTLTDMELIMIGGQVA